MQPVLQTVYKKQAVTQFEKRTLKKKNKQLNSTLSVCLLISCNSQLEGKRGLVFSSDSRNQTSNFPVDTLMRT